MPENLITKRINTLIVDSLALGLVLPVDSLYLQNVYVDVDDTHIRTAAFSFSAELVGGSVSIDLPASTIGSIYHLQLLNVGAQVISVFFAMPMQDTLLSELDLYTAYPPREGYPIQAPLWGEIEGDISDQFDLFDNFMTKGDGTSLSEEVESQIEQYQQNTAQSILNVNNQVTDVDNKLKVLFVTSAESKIVNGVTIPAGTYLDVQAHLAKESITGDRIVKGAQLNEPIIKNPKLSETYAATTLDAPNLTLAADGTLKRSNDPLNASTRKVGNAAGNLVERDANGYPVNNNAVGDGQTWQDFTSSRQSSVTYTNSTNRSIVVFTKFKSNTGNTETISLEGFVGSVLVASDVNITSRDTHGCSVSFIVPANAQYSVVKSQYISLLSWSELR